MNIVDDTLVSAVRYVNCQYDIDIDEHDQNLLGILRLHYAQTQDSVLNEYLTSCEKNMSHESHEQSRTLLSFNGFFR
ncbi:MAG: hypothetical protein ACRBHB_18925 [Arenicella sp.]